MAKIPSNIHLTIKRDFTDEEYKELYNMINNVIENNVGEGYTNMADEILGQFIREKGFTKGEEPPYKPYIAVVDSNNQLIIDLALKDPKEPAVVMDGYHLIQSDEPMSVIVDEDGKVFLHE